MNNYKPLSGMPPAVKVIIIINVIIFLGINIMSQRSDLDLVNILGLHLPQSEYFRIYQYITHMFTQEGLAHLFFNMFAVFMFGRILESGWGTKRFVIYYFVTGLGAAVLHSLVSWYGLHNMQEQFYAFQSTPDPGVFAEFVRSHVSNPRLLTQLMQFVDTWNQAPGNSQFIGQAEYYMQGIIQAYTNVPTIGASGAVFGILLAFGMLFPNTELFLMFIPIPIKAKYFVLLYGAAELFFGLQNSVGDNVAHFAHLGGMLFGFFLIIYWRKRSKRFY